MFKSFHFLHFLIYYYDESSLAVALLNTLSMSSAVSFKKLYFSFRNDVLLWEVTCRQLLLVSSKPDPHE